MNVLFLGPTDSPLAAAIASSGDRVVLHEEALTDTPSADFLVSFGYRHIIPRFVVGAYRDRAVNLHISLLPWNRGADPNLWSFLEGTPGGVSIHLMDAGIDTGPVLVQARVRFEGPHTLRSSYQLLQERIAALFIEHWPNIREGKMRQTPQTGRGTFHRTADKDTLPGLLPKGWDTPVEFVERYGIEHGLRLSNVRGA